MFISKARHAELIRAKDAEIKALHAEIARTGMLLQSARDGRSIAEREGQTLRAELAPLKAAKARQLQNLADANARRKAAALPASVKGEG